MSMPHSGTCTCPDCRDLDEFEPNQSAAPTHAALVAQVAELTRERDFARAGLDDLNDEIDSLKSEVARLKEELAAAEQRISELFEVHVHAKRAEAAEARVKELEERDAQRDHAWSVDVGHLRRAESECAALRVENQHLRDIEDGQRTRAEKAEDECAALRAELADSRKFWAESKELEINARLAAEARLDATNALLAEAPRDYLWPDWNERVAAHLTNQPSAPTAIEHQVTPPYAVLGDESIVPLMNCPECKEMGRADMAHYHVCKRVCTEAEQRVLDACCQAVTRVAWMGRAVLQLTEGSQQQIADAVVAWREEKNQNEED